MSETQPSLGDNVRIRSTKVTEQSGHSGRVGICHGFTTPSVTGVEVDGISDLDLAYVVSFDDSEAWFAPDLVEVVDHAPGSEIQIGEKRFIRSADGHWDHIE